MKDSAAALAVSDFWYSAPSGWSDWVTLAKPIWEGAVKRSVVGEPSCVCFFHPPLFLPLWSREGTRQPKTSGGQLEFRELLLTWTVKAADFGVGFCTGIYKHEPSLKEPQQRAERALCSELFINALHGVVVMRNYSFPFQPFSYNHKRVTFLASLFDIVRIIHASLISGRLKPNICAKFSVAVTDKHPVVKAQGRVPSGKRNVTSRTFLSFGLLLSPLHHPHPHPHRHSMLLAERRTAPRINGADIALLIALFRQNVSVRRKAAVQICVFKLRFNVTFLAEHQY